ncbi:MAG: PAS domain S-box protein [Ignavibacteriales bacterium]|nr:PAS domain S-box protein [Ignavibacteriales bacterium]
MKDQTKVLLVDDEETPREILSLALQERGFQTIQAGNGVEAMEILHREKVDVVVSDILMPHMDGYRLCYEIRKDERLKWLPFIIFTGTYTAPADEKLGMEFGANIYLKKSGSVDDVVDAVQDVLKQAAKPSQRDSLDELDVMKVYSERLVVKLEEKNIELEQAKNELLKKNEELERMANALRADIAERKKTEEQLKQSEERFATAFHANPALITLSNPSDGTFIDVNESYLRTMGYQREEVIGKKSTELGMWVDDTRAKAVEILRERRSLHNFETRIRTKSGEERMILTSAEMIELRGKECILGMSYDITERKRAEEALRESEGRLRTILESEPECVKIMGPGCILVEMNPAGLSMIEADSLTQVQGGSVIDIVAPEYRKSFEELAKRVFEGETGMLQFEIIGLKGTKRWLETHATPLRDREGRVMQILSVTRDITERKVHEQALKTAEEKYRSIFQNAVEGIFQSTAAGRYISVNPAMARILGYQSPEELMSLVQDIGRQVYANPVRRAEFLRLLEEKGEIREFEYEAFKKDGTKIWLSSNAKAVRGSDGAVSRYEGSIMDVTVRKLTEEKMKELTRKVIETQELERKRIARELHDSIGQMLSTVKFRIQSAGEKITSQKSRIWKDLSDAWTLLEQSIHEVRRVSHNLRPSILDDLGLVSAVRNMCEEFSARTHIKVSLKSSRFSSRLVPEVELSVFRIIQEALNNVEQHSQATRLALQIQKKNSHLVVNIKDNGKGFDPHAAYRQRSRARGFGLDGIRERVSTLGGSVNVRTALNEGVHLLIEIPLITLTKNQAN